MLFSKFCAALTTLDLSVPSRPPLHAAPTGRSRTDGAKKRHRLCTIARNPDLRHKVHEHLGDGHGLNRIARSIGATGTSRSALARYVRLYKRAANSWTINRDVAPKELPASLRAFQKTFGEFQSYLSERDIDEKERLRRSELPLKQQPERQAGASPESINFIKAKILGLDVDHLSEVID